jgi:hypothetical protein
VDIGAFISAIIYFVIVKTCPACLSTDLPAAASRCKYCGTDQPAEAA